MSWSNLLEMEIGSSDEIVSSNETDGDGEVYVNYYSPANEEIA